MNLVPFLLKVSTSQFLVQKRQDHAARLGQNNVDNINLINLSNNNKVFTTPNII